MTADERLALVAAARGYLRVPYRHRGRNRLGLDCAGLLWRAFADVGVVMDDERAYSPQPDGRLRDAVVARLGEPFWKAGDALELLAPGDVVTLRWHQHPNHVALVTDYYLGGLALIHSYAEAGQVVEHRLDDQWAARLIEGWRP